MPAQDFAKSYLLSLGLPADPDPTKVRIISDKPHDVTKYHATRELIFQLVNQPEKEAWRVLYEILLMDEGQGQQPWPDGYESVKVFPMELRERTIQEWVPV